MDYDFPTKRLQPEELASPKALNGDIQSVGNRLLQVTGHNIEAADTAANATEAMYMAGAIYVDEHFEDPGYDEGTGGFSYPDDTSGQKLDDIGSWTEVENLEITLTTGTSELTVDVSVQYIWHSFIPVAADVPITTPPFDGWDHIAADCAYREVNRTTSIYGTPTSPTDTLENLAYDDLTAINSGDFAMAGVQFAFSISGQIVEPSITGHLGVHRRDFLPVKARYERTDTTPAPGPQTPRTAPITGLGATVYQARCGYIASVEPGTYVIKVYAKRVPVPHRGTTAAKRSDDDFIRLLSRKIMVCDKPIWAAPRDYSSTIAIPPFNPDDTLTSASMLTNRMAVARNFVNALPAAAIKPWSLRRAHLPRTLIDANIASQVPGSFSSTESLYPGYGHSRDQIIDTTGTGVGWYQVRDGVTKLEVAGSGGAWDSTISSFFRIKANIEIIKIANSDTVFRMSDAVALAIGYLPTGSADWVIIQNSVAIYGKSNVWTYDENPTAIVGFDNIDGSLFTWLDLRPVQHGVTIDKFSIFISLISPKDEAVEVFWNSASIQVVQELP
jgi:hypothetical protein